MTFSINSGDDESEESEGEPDWYELVLEELDIDEDQLREEMEAKREQYEGLVTLDSSLAILVARDHGVNMVDEYAERNYGIDIENIIEGMSSVELECQVDEIPSINTFDGGQVRGLTISDSTGTTQASFWDEDAETIGEKVREGDKIRIKGGYTKKEMSDYQQSRFGIPAIQISDDATVEVMREEDGEFVEII